MIIGFYEHVSDSWMTRKLVNTLSMFCNPSIVQRIKLVKEADAPKDDTAQQPHNTDPTQTDAYKASAAVVANMPKEEKLISVYQCSVR